MLSTISGTGLIGLDVDRRRAAPGSSLGLLVTLEPLRGGVFDAIGRVRRGGVFIPVRGVTSRISRGEVARGVERAR
jgi:hypothetical protein